jgi:hypothetical protein
MTYWGTEFGQNELKKCFCSTVLAAEDKAYTNHLLAENVTLTTTHRKWIMSGQSHIQRTYVCLLILVSSERHGVQLRKLVSDVDKPRDLMDDQKHRSFREAKDQLKNYLCCIRHSFSQPALHHCIVSLSYNKNPTLIYSTPLQVEMLRLSMA